MAIRVVYDSCVLYGASLRDLLLRLARTDLFRAHWSEEILDETVASLLTNRRDISPERLARTRRVICENFPASLVSGYEDLVPSLELPDPGDRHVLAAAIRCGARVIVTNNLRDFPHDALRTFHIEAQTPDDFVSYLLGLAPQAVAQTVTEQANSLKAPPMTVVQIIERLAQSGLRRSAWELSADCVRLKDSSSCNVVRVGGYFCGGSAGEGD